jgi:hypothetical protein
LGADPGSEREQKRAFAEVSRNSCSNHRRFCQEWIGSAARISRIFERLKIDSIGDLPSVFSRLDTETWHNLHSAANEFRHSSDPEHWKLAEWIYLNILTHPEGPSLDRGRSYVGMAKIHTRKEMLPEAEEFVREGLAKFPENGRLLFMSGIIEELTSKSDGVEKVHLALQRAQIEKDPFLETEARIFLGHAKHGRDRGVVHFREALELARENRDVHNRNRP